MIRYFILLFLWVFLACENKSTPDSAKNSIYHFEVSEMTDDQYPDNPDIGYRSTKYGVGYFETGALIAKEKNDYDLCFYTKSNDTIIFRNFELMEFIPTVPKHLKKDKYLAHLSIVNQEWNRNQVKYTLKDFRTTDPTIIRIDVARNCLNAYLWEVIAYSLEEGKEVPIYHGWFDFPKSLYAELFKQKNHQSITPYLQAIENWKDPKHFSLKKDFLRIISSSVSVKYADESDAMYPVKGERKRKFKEIVLPVKFSSMRDLQNDSTTFATFSQPGFYNRSDPRKTQLGRFFSLQEILVFKTKSMADQKEYHEIELSFEDKDNNRVTKLVFGGLNFTDFPKLSPESANNGWKNSMGFSNHTFYEDKQLHQTCKSETNPYYGFLTDEKGRWLDSHQIGIDGPLFHWDDKQSNLLHIWLLSFERHALVGHYTVLFDHKVTK